MQWREVSAIAGAIKKNGTPNHLLVNFVTNYPYSHFISYAKLVRDEMTKRKYRTSESVWEKIISLDSKWDIIPYNNIYVDKMSKEYFLICYYNLYEKRTCGGISKDFWLMIEDKKNFIIKEE